MTQEIHYKQYLKCGAWVDWSIAPKNEGVKGRWQIFRIVSSPAHNQCVCRRQIDQVVDGGCYLSELTWRTVYAEEELTEVNITYCYFSSPFPRLPNTAEQSKRAV